jgi:predicted nucleotidyltransferase
VFTVPERERLLDELVRHALADGSVTAAALVGSGARHQTDRWSDIDLALRLGPEADPVSTAQRWERYLSSGHQVADRLDVWSGTVLYRVFLLADSLQVDVSFAPAAVFASTGEPFELLFGEANPAQSPVREDAHDPVGWAWLYALHARSAIARGRPWQAVQMLDGLRERIVALACTRHGVPAHQGRGTDQLPPDLLTELSRTLVADPERSRLAAALGAAIELLLAETDHVDPARAQRLQLPLTTLVDTVS